MMNFDRAGIADRVRALLGEGAKDLAATAARLRVDEIALRMSVDEMSPHPTVDVLAAVIRDYGVDPSWLLTGAYDLSAHRSAADSKAAAVAALKDFVDSRMAISSEMLLPEDYKIRPKES
jgi:hypothetical protein